MKPRAAPASGSSVATLRPSLHLVTPPEPSDRPPPTPVWGTLAPRSAPVVNADACPECGTIVAAVWTRTLDSSTPESATQGNACPECGSRLRRTVGQPWHRDEGARS